MPPPQLETIPYESERIRPSSNAARLTLTLRDVLSILIPLILVAGAFFSLRSDVANLRDSMQDVKQDIRDMRHEFEKTR